MATPRYETDAPVLYALADGIATLTLNRPQYGHLAHAHRRQAVMPSAASACARWPRPTRPG